MGGRSERRFSIEIFVESRVRTIASPFLRCLRAYFRCRRVRRRRGARFVNSRCSREGQFRSVARMLGFLDDLFPRGPVASPLSPSFLLRSGCYVGPRKIRLARGRKTCPPVVSYVRCIRIKPLYTLYCPVIRYKIPRCISSRDIIWVRSTRRAHALLSSICLSLFVALRSLSRPHSFHDAGSERPFPFHYARSVQAFRVRTYRRCLFYFDRDAHYFRPRW